MEKEHSRSVGRVARFGDFEIDATAFELRKLGRRIKIQDLPFRLLIALSDRPGETVSHEQLRSLLWGDTVVDFEAGLHTAVRKLREVLGDSAAEPLYVETVPRHGYRFIATVHCGPSADLGNYGAGQVRPASKALPYLLAAVASLAAITGLTRDWHVSDAASLGPAIEVVPLVAERGLLRSPTLSPDGRRVAFSWAREAEENLDLYVQEIDGAGRKRLTADSASDRLPAWSPDGVQIAFLRDRQVYMIPAAGGLERRLTTAEESGLAWSPDSRTLAVSDREAPTSPASIFLVDVESGARRNLSKPPNSTLEDRWPTFSPDGRYVAFSRNATTMTEIYLVPVAGGESVRVVRDLGAGRNLTGLVWSPNGDHLLFAIGRLGLFAVSSSDRDSTNLVRIDAAGEDVMHPSVVRQPVSGEAYLAYGRERSNWDIFAGNLNEREVSPTPIQASTRSDAAPAISPDGNRLAFTSVRSGTPEIWVSSLDGSLTTRLTRFNSGTAGTPQWSPDGKWLAFDATIEGNRDVYTVASDGTQLRRMTEENSADGQASWSRDGQNIYFMSDRSGVRQIWKMRADGNAAPVQLTQGGGYQAFESPDGQTVYYAKRQQKRGIWSVPSGGGREQIVTESARHNLWAAADDGLYYFDLDGIEPAVFEFPQPCPVRKLDYRTGKVTTVAVISTDLPDTLPSFGLSRDGKRLTWLSQQDPGSELLLMRNLRLD